MLVLTRRLGEMVVIPSLGATIRVHRIKGGSVALAVDAPASVRVLRDELVPRAATDSADHIATRRRR